MIFHMWNVKYHSIRLALNFQAVLLEILFELLTEQYASSFCAIVISLNTSQSILIFCIDC